MSHAKCSVIWSRFLYLRSIFATNYVSFLLTYLTICSRFSFGVDITFHFAYEYENATNSHPNKIQRRSFVHEWAECRCTEFSYLNSIQIYPLKLKTSEDSRVACYIYKLNKLNKYIQKAVLADGKSKRELAVVQSKWAHRIDCLRRGDVMKGYLFTLDSWFTWSIVNYHVP